MGTTEQLIENLKKSNLYAECGCGGEFKLSESILFDGSKPFPEEALEVQAQYKTYLEEREEDLKKRKKLATERAEITTKAVNIGKSLEKILPSMEDFKWKLADCRFLGDPIDLLTFDGLSISSINHLGFIEVKSGRARLNKHQKAIRDAVDEFNVSYKVYK